MMRPDVDQQRKVERGSQSYYSHHSWRTQHDTPGHVATNKPASVARHRERQMWDNTSVVPAGRNGQSGQEGLGRTNGNNFSRLWGLGTVLGCPVHDLRTGVPRPAAWDRDTGRGWGSYWLPSKENWPVSNQDLQTASRQLHTKKTLL